MPTFGIPCLLSLSGCLLFCWPSWFANTAYQRGHHLRRGTGHPCWSCHTHKKTWDMTEEAPGCMPERDAGEVSSSRACLEGSPLHHIGKGHSGGHGKTPRRIASQGSPPNPCDACWGMLLQGHQAWDPQLLGGCLQEAGNQTIATLFLDFWWHLLMSLVWIAVTPEGRCRYKYNVFLTNYHFALKKPVHSGWNIDKVFSPFLAGTQNPLLLRNGMYWICSVGSRIKSFGILKQQLINCYIIGYVTTAAVLLIWSTKV